MAISYKVSYTPILSPAIPFLENKGAKNIYPPKKKKKKKQTCTGIFIVALSTASLVAQMAKNPPAMREAWVQSLDWEDPLEKGTATHSGILAWRIPWTEEPGRLQSMGLQRVGHD